MWHVELKFFQVGSKHGNSVQNLEDAFVQGLSVVPMLYRFVSTFGTLMFILYFGIRISQEYSSSKLPNRIDNLEQNPEDAFV